MGHAGRKMVMIDLVHPICHSDGSPKRCIRGIRDIDIAASEASHVKSVSA